MSPRVKSASRKKKQAVKPAAEALPAPAPPSPSLSATLAGWALVLLGTWELFRWFPQGAFAPAELSALALALGAAAFLWGASLLAKQPHGEKDPALLWRLSLLVLLVFCFKNGWEAMSPTQWTAGVLACLLWFYLNLSSSEASAADDPPAAWLPVALLAIVGVAAWLRFHKIMEVPHGINTDEVTNALLYKTRPAEGWNLFFSLGGHSMVAYFSPFYFLVRFLNIFGLQGVYCIRLAAALWGLVGLGSFYLFMRELFGWRPALWGLVFLSISSFSIMVSRIEVCDPAGVALESFIFYFFWKGLKGSRFWLVVTGLIIGLYLHGHYLTHFMLPLFLAVFLIVRWIVGALRGKSLIWTLLVIFVSFAPIYLNVASQLPEINSSMAQRMDQAKAASYSGFEQAYHVTSNNFITYLNFYIAPQNGNALVYNPSRPLIDPWSAGLLLLGAFAALAGLRRGKMETLFLLGYFLALLLPASASESAPAMHRIALQIPVLFGLVGVAADRLIRFPDCREFAIQKWFSTTALLLCLGLAAWWNYRTFFVSFADNYQCREYWGGMLSDVASVMRQAPQKTELIVSDAWANDFRSTTLPYYSGRDYRWSDTTLDSLFPQTGTAGVQAFVLEEPSLELASGIFNYLYPHCALHPVADPSHGGYAMYRESSVQNKRDIFCYYQIPAEDVDAARGLEFNYSGPGGSQAVQHLGVEWPSQAQAGSGSNASWEGAIWIPKTQVYEFRGSLPQGMELRLDGKILAPNAPVLLGRGFYPFQAQSKQPGPFGKEGGMSLAGKDGLSIDFSQPNNFRGANFARGLRASYYHSKIANGPLASLPKQYSLARLKEFLKAEEDLAFSRIEPTVFARWTVSNYVRSMEIPAPFDIIWEANLELPQDGSYAFYDENQTPLDLWVDGKRVRAASPGGPPPALSLKKGGHRLCVFHRALRDSNQYMSPVTLLVSGPDGVSELLPMAWLKP